MSRTRGVVVRQSLPATWPGSGALSLRGLLRGSFAATPPDAPGPGRHCGVAPCFETPEPGVVTSAGRRVAVVSQGCSVQTPKKPAGGRAATAGLSPGRVPAGSPGPRTSTHGVPPGTAGSPPGPGAENGAALHVFGTGAASTLECLEV